MEAGAAAVNGTARSFKSAGSQSGCLCCPRWGNSTEAAQMGAMLHSTSHDLQTLQTQNLLSTYDVRNRPTIFQRPRHTTARLYSDSTDEDHTPSTGRRQPDAVSHQVSINFMLHQTSGAPTTCCFSVKAVQKYSKHENRVRKAKLAWM